MSQEDRDEAQFLSFLIGGPEPDFLSEEPLAETPDPTLEQMQARIDSLKEPGLYGQKTH